MPVRVLLTVSLHGMYELRRREFDAEMLKRNWVKYPGKTGIYCIFFPDLESDRAVVAAAESDAEEAAEAAKIFGWNAICVIENSENDSTDVTHS